MREGDTEEGDELIQAKGAQERLLPLLSDDWDQASPEPYNDMPASGLLPGTVGIIRKAQF